MGKRIIAYLLFIVGFLVLTFFKNYVGTVIPYPILTWLLGLGLFFFGWLLIRITPTVKVQKETRSEKKIIDDLKCNGEKIKVDFSVCELKSNDYSEEEENYNGGLTSGYSNNIQAFNVLSGDEMENVKLVEKYQSVLIFKNSCKGEMETYVSSVITTEHTTLLFKLDVKKFTTIYVDKQDRTKYYFDMEFLNA